jgi:hypothetical protein
MGIDGWAAFGNIRRSISWSKKAFGISRYDAF